MSDRETLREKLRHETAHAERHGRAEEARVNISLTVSDARVLLAALSAPSPDPHDKWVEDTIKALKNSGVDTECGACIEIAFSGMTQAEHECKPTPDLRGLVEQAIEVIDGLAGSKTCDEEPDACGLDSGPYCMAHVFNDAFVTEARACLSILQQLRAALTEAPKEPR